LNKSVSIRRTFSLAPLQSFLSKSVSSFRRICWFTSLDKILSLSKSKFDVGVKWHWALTRQLWHTIQYNQTRQEFLIKIRDIFQEKFKYPNFFIFLYIQELRVSLSVCLFVNWMGLWTNLVGRTVQWAWQHDIWMNLIGRAVQGALQYDKVGEKWHFLGSTLPVLHPARRDSYK